MFRALARHQFIRFLGVGLLNTVFGYGIYWLLLALGLHYSAAVLLSTVLGVAFNFKSMGALVFGTRGNRGMLRFAACYIVVYACNLLTIGAFVRAGLTPQEAGALTLLPMALLAYFLTKKFVFVAP